MSTEKFPVAGAEKFPVAGAQMAPDFLELMQGLLEGAFIPKAFLLDPGGRFVGTLTTENKVVPAAGYKFLDNPPRLIPDSMIGGYPGARGGGSGVKKVL